MDNSLPRNTSCMPQISTLLLFMCFAFRFVLGLFISPKKANKIMCYLAWESLSREIKVEETMETKLLSKLELSLKCDIRLINKYHSRECHYAFRSHFNYILP